MRKLPNPNNVTPADVLKEIDKLTDENSEYGYSFGHIVIDDKNLSNSCILFCLDVEWMNNCIGQRYTDTFDGKKYDELAQWEHNIYHEDVLLFMFNQMQLLVWLLEVDETVREEAEELYWSQWEV